MTIRPIEFHREFPALANPIASVTDTWPLKKLTRVFCRYLDDEFESLAPDARLKGRDVHSFLTGPFFAPNGMKSHKDRTDAVKAIDAFIEARRPQQSV